MAQLVLPDGASAPVVRPDPGPVPVAGPGQVVVRMAAGGLNRIDRMLCAGRVPPPPGDHVLGAQGAGHVVAAGPGVAAPAPGALVGLYPYGGCGACEACQAGNETLCRDARLDGVNAPGMFSAHYVAAARDAVAVPPGVTPALAATASALAVAWHVLVCRGGLQRGETVAIASISSGLGACCGALAAQLGAEVVGVARRPTLEALRRTPPWLSRTWAPDDDGRPPRVDLAVDAVGAPTLPALHRMLRTGGRLVSVGAHAGGDVTLDVWRLFTREQDLRGSHGCHRTDMDHAVAALPLLAEEDMVDGVYALRDFAAAYRRLDTPGRLGNVLLDLTEGST